MKCSVVFVAAFAAFSHAQSACEASAEGIPACALGYIASAGYANYGCGIVDFACQCSNSASIQQDVQTSIVNKCPSADAISALNAVPAVCSCASANSGQSISLNSIESKCQASAAAIPACGLGYVAEAARTIGSCALYDFECQCSNAAAVQSSVSSIVSSACSGADAVLSSAAALCACVAGSGSGSGGGGGGGTGSTSATTTAGGSASSAPTTSASPSQTSAGIKPTSSASGSESGPGAGISTGASSSSGASGVTTTGGTTATGSLPPLQSSTDTGSLSLTMFTGAAAAPSFGVIGGGLAILGGLVAVL